MDTSELRKYIEGEPGGREWRRGALDILDRMEAADAAGHGRRVIVDVEDSAERCPVCGAEVGCDPEGPVYADEGVYETYLSCDRCGAEWATRFEFAGNEVTRIDGEDFDGVTLRGKRRGVQEVGANA